MMNLSRVTREFERWAGEHTCSLPTSLPLSLEGGELVRQTGTQGDSVLRFKSPRLVIMPIFVYPLNNRIPEPFLNLYRGSLKSCRPPWRSSSLSSKPGKGMEQTPQRCPMIIRLIILTRMLILIALCRKRIFGIAFVIWCPMFKMLVTEMKNFVHVILMVCDCDVRICQAQELR